MNDYLNQGNLNQGQLNHGDLEKQIIKVINNQEDIPVDDVEADCHYCGGENVIGIGRIVGYFSELQNWNKSKLAERKRRLD